jgi:hypothetical protein
VKGRPVRTWRPFGVLASNFEGKAHDDRHAARKLLPPDSHHHESGLSTLGELNGL